MEALVLESIGKLVRKNVDNPVSLDGEVLVKVKACGICGSDIPRVYQNGAHRMPLIIGHEFSGEIAENGKPVGIFPLIPCMNCEPCKKRLYEMCRNYSYLGSRRDGGFAQYVSVPKKNLIDLPEGTSYEAAAMLEPMAVSVHAIRQVGLIPKSGDSKVCDTDKDMHIVVCGAGTIGLLIVMFLKDAGYQNVSIIGNRDIQKKMAEVLGVSDSQFYDTRDENRKELSRKLVADVFFECVGKQETYEQAVNQTGPAGKICLVGNPYSDMDLPRDIYWKILRNQLTVTGTWNSSFTGEEDDDWHYVVSRLAAGTIHPENLITHKFSLDDATKGFEIMRDKTEDYVKVMITL